jgi:hypothetical protein
MVQKEKCELVPGCVAEKRSREEHPVLPPLMTVCVDVVTSTVTPIFINNSCQFVSLSQAKTSKLGAEKGNPHSACTAPVIGITSLGQTSKAPNTKNIQQCTMLCKSVL